MYDVPCSAGLRYLAPFGQSADVAESLTAEKIPWLACLRAGTNGRNEMHEKDESVERVVNRRRLLKRAGVLAAGAGAVVAGAVVAAPAAEDATGDPVLQGHADAAGTGSTGLSAGPAANLPTLELANTESAVDGVGNTPAGAPLRLVPSGDLLSDTA